jgi:hypothetical protein
MSRLVDWVRTNRSKTATALSSVLIVGLVAGVSVVSGGYEQRRVDLDDGTVWVANGSRSAIGRANPDVGELNTAVRSQGSDIAVEQNGDDVVLVDRTTATVGVVDTATATADVSTPLPPERPEVLLAPDRAVVVSGGTGDLWSSPVAELASFSTDAPAELSLGRDLVVDSTPAGAIVAFSAASGTLSTIEGSSGLDVVSSESVATTGEGPYQVASVGSHGVLLDTLTGELFVDGRSVELPSLPDGGFALQRSSTTGDSVVVATSTGLISVALAGGR